MEDSVECIDSYEKSGYSTGTVLREPMSRDLRAERPKNGFKGGGLAVTEALRTASLDQEFIRLAATSSELGTLVMSESHHGRPIVRQLI
jgi:hypothetical protein